MGVSFSSSSEAGCAQASSVSLTPASGALALLRWANASGPHGHFIGTHFGSKVIIGHSSRFIPIRSE